MGRPSCCDKLNVKRGLWKAEEDAKLLACISKYGCGNWTLVPKKAGLNRCGKSCRLRWTNYLKPDLKHDNFTSQEEVLIINLHRAIGSRWSMIARELPGRTDNDVKNYWNTKLRKRLSNMGIDPVTHKPISHVLSDYENLSCFPKSAANCQITSFSTQSSSACIGSYQYANMMLRPAIQQQIQDNSLRTDLSPQFLSQFQTMNQDYGTYQPFFLNEITSSCSSSSSSSTSHVTELNSPTSFSCQQSESQISPSSLNWTGYLLHDPCVQSGESQEEQNHAFLESFSSTNLVSLLQSDTSQPKFNKVSECRARAIEDESCSQACGVGSTIGTSNQAKGCSSSSNSFVDSILDQDTEMRGLFPEFLDGYSDY